MSVCEINQSFTRSLWEALLEHMLLSRAVAADKIQTAQEKVYQRQETAFEVLRVRKWNPGIAYRLLGYSVDTGKQESERPYKRYSVPWDLKYWELTVLHISMHKELADKLIN